MRISDWSSDVCSSDLKHGDNQPSSVLSGGAMHEEGQLAVRYGFEQRPDIWRKGLWHGRIVDPHRFQRALNGGVRAQNVPSAVAVRPKLSEIGRASCRERVCQYV